LPARRFARFARRFARLVRRFARFARRNKRKIFFYLGKICGL